MWWFSFALADDVNLLLNDPGEAPADACTSPACVGLLSMLEGAQTQVDWAFYGFRRQSALLGAMRAAVDRGVNVRGVVDRDASGGNPYDDTDAWVAALPEVVDDRSVDERTLAARRSWIGRDRCARPAGHAGPLQCGAFVSRGRCLLTAQASVEPIEFRGEIMHDKVAVVDHQAVWTGSANASDSCTGGYNANVALRIDSPVVAGWYEGELAQMRAGAFHREKESQAPMRARLGEDLGVEVLFSPQHDVIDEAVMPRLADARHTLDVAVFFLTHRGLVQALIDAAGRGVKVRVILDASGASNEYSKHEVLRAAGIPVKVEDFGGKMHAKAVAVDGRLLIAGSMNWTDAGAEVNDENTVFVWSVARTAAFGSWYERLWQRIPDRWLAGRPDPESLDSGPACRDGADNDYDGLVDERDPGCAPGAPPMVDPRPMEAPLVDGACRWPSP